MEHPAAVCCCAAAVSPNSSPTRGTSRAREKPGDVRTQKAWWRCRGKLLLPLRVFKQSTVTRLQQRQRLTRLALNPSCTCATATRAATLAATATRAAVATRASSRAPRQNHALHIDGHLVCTFCMFRNRQLVLVSLFLRPRVREDLLPPSELGLKAPLQRPPP